MRNLNETNRVEGIQSGNPEKIIKGLLKKTLASSKYFASEPSAFEVSMIAGRRDHLILLLMFV